MSPDRVAQEAPWLLWLLELMQRGQEFLLQLLHRIGLTESVDGQPAWPWPRRLAGENLLLDVGQARAVVWSLMAIAAVVCLLLLAVFWWRHYRRRWAFLATALLIVIAIPWPQQQVIWVPASPSSFHYNPVSFSDVAIAKGAVQYQRLCMDCHGATGNGQGAMAAQQTIWPPSFTGPLLWRRTDGDLLHAVRHGVFAPSGQRTMPGFSSQITVAQTWELLHFLRAQAAGQLLQLSGNWVMPIALPNMQLHCPGKTWQQVSDLQQQRVRLVGLADVKSVLPDPRMLTVWLPPANQSASFIPAQIDCVVASASEARQALFWLTGAENFTQTQLLADKAGWLRARNDRGADSWSEADLVCRVNEVEQGAQGGTQEYSLTQLLRSMDSQPLVYVKGGSVHGLQ